MLLIRLNEKRVGCVGQDAVSFDGKREGMSLFEELDWKGLGRM